jgi:multiple sugar transport system substrate-binding protein
VTRRALFGSAAVVGTTALAACGAGTQETAGTAPKTQSPVTLRYVASFGPSGATTFAGGLTKLVDTYNAKGTPVQVQPITPTGNRNEAALTMIAAGDPPDLFHALPRDYHPFANMGALLEMDPYMKKDRKVTPDVVPAILEYWSRDGKHYAMPNNWSPQAIYFNKAMFDKQGLKTPDQYEKEGKWTFDVYLDLARKLTSGSGEQKIWGAPWVTDALDIQLAFIWPFGGDMWDKAMQNALLDSSEALEAIQFQADMSGKYGVSPVKEEEKQLSRGIGGAISAERGAMEILTTDVVGMIIPTTFAKGMAPMPKGKGGRIVRANPIGVHIMKGSKNPDAAWDYVTFQSGTDSARIMLEMHLTVPWLKSLFSSPEYAKLLMPWESAAAYAESSSKVRPTPYPPTFADINGLYAPAYQTVRAGQKSARQAMTEIKAQVNDLLRKKG